MNNTIQISVRNSELSTPKEKRIFLTYPAQGLAACSLEEMEDGVLFTFNIEGLDKSELVLSRTKDKEQQLRFLANCADLAKLHNEYKFSLSTDNIMTDINLRPWILLRDSQSVGSGGSGGSVGYNGGISSISSASNISNIHNTPNTLNDYNAPNTPNTPNNHEKAFLSKYKSLIGSFLLPKYNYQDFEKGGEDLFKKNKLLQELSEMDNVLTIKSRLTKEYHNLVKETEQTRTHIPKQTLLATRIAIPLLSLSLLAATFFAITAFLNHIPYRNQVITANQAYIAGDPLEVQRALSGFDTNQLSHQTRHILSRAYVLTEPLSESQRTNIMMGLTPITDTTIFDYWIHLGRLEFYQAIDIAQRFGDNELLLFAYLRQEAAIRVDPNLTGAEMVAALNYLEGRINALQRDRDGILDVLEVLGGGLDGDGSE